MQKTEQQDKVSTTKVISRYSQYMYNKVEVLSIAHLHLLCVCVRLSVCPCLCMCVSVCVCVCCLYPNKISLEFMAGVTATLS